MARGQIAGKQWKRKVLWLGIGFCLVLAKTENGFAAEVRNQQYGWEEEFTDTDTRTGILAVRGEVFQGVGGRVQVGLEEMETGRETEIVMTGEGGYLANEELRPGRYQVVSVEANSEGRKFDCRVECEEIEVKADEVTLCWISVEPGSVYQVPYGEETETGEEGQRKEITIVTEEGISNEEAAGKELDIGQKEDDSAAKPYPEERGKVPMVLLMAALGIGVSLHGILLVVKNGKK